MSDTARRLLRLGALLFFLGLVNGGAVSVFTNSRMGLSSHLAGVQNGMVLMIFGLLWARLDLTPGLLRLTERCAIFSMYAIWLALLLAAIFGTSRTTPIAGAGHEGALWQEAVVALLLYTGSAAILVAAAFVFRGLCGRGPGEA
jgi:hydroxylaminobenzene mutase